MRHPTSSARMGKDTSISSIRSTSPRTRSTSRRHRAPTTSATTVRMSPHRSGEYEQRHRHRRRRFQRLVDEREGPRRTGSGARSTIINGIVWAADHGAKVINMSLGFGTPALCAASMQAAVDYAWNKGVVIVAATGNEGAGGASEPGNCRHVISVAATDQNDQKASFSNYGPNVTVAAPGVSILSTDYVGSYVQKSGTSMASPHVAGLAALIWSTVYGTSNAAVESRIRETADAINGTGTLWSVYGGRINAASAVTSAATLCALARNYGAYGQFYATHAYNYAYYAYLTSGNQAAYYGFVYSFQRTCSRSTATATTTRTIPPSPPTTTSRATCTPTTSISMSPPRMVPRRTSMPCTPRASVTPPARSRPRPTHAPIPSATASPSRPAPMASAPPAHLPRPRRRRRSRWPARPWPSRLRRAPAPRRRLRPARPGRRSALRCSHPGWPGPPGEPDRLPACHHARDLPRHEPAVTRVTTEVSRIPSQPSPSNRASVSSSPLPDVADPASLAAPAEALTTLRDKINADLWPLLTPTQRTLFQTALGLWSDPASSDPTVRAIPASPDPAVSVSPSKPTRDDTDKDRRLSPPTASSASAPTPPPRCLRLGRQRPRPPLRSSHPVPDVVHGRSPSIPTTPPTSSSPPAIASNSSVSSVRRPRSVARSRWATTSRSTASNRMSSSSTSRRSPSSIPPTCANAPRPTGYPTYERVPAA